MSSGGQLRWSIVVEASGDQIRVVQSQLEGFNNTVDKTTSKLHALNASPRDGVTNYAGSINNMYQSVQKVNPVLGIFGNTLRSQIEVAKGAAPDIARTSAAYDGMSTSALTLGQRIKVLGLNIRDHAGAFGTAASSVFLLYNAYDNLRRMQLSVDRINIQSERLRNTATIAENKLTASLSAGKLTAEQAATATERVRVMRERANVSTAIAAHNEEEFQKAQLGFITQVGPLSIITLTEMTRFIDILTVKSGGAVATFKKMASDFTGFLTGVPARAKAAAASMAGIQAPVPVPVAKPAISTVGVTAPTIGQGAIMAETAAMTSLTAAEQENILVKAGMTEADANATVAKANLTRATLEEALAGTNASRVEIEEAASALGLAEANEVATVSEVELGTAAKGTAASLASSMAAMAPLLVVIAGGIAIYHELTEQMQIQKDTTEGLISPTEALTRQMNLLSTSNFSSLESSLLSIFNGLDPVLQAFDLLRKFGVIKMPEFKVPKKADFGEFEEFTKGLEGMDKKVGESMDGTASAVGTAGGEITKHFAQMKMDSEEVTKSMGKSLKDMPKDIRSSWGTEVPALKNLLVTNIGDAVLQSNEKLVSLKDVVANKIKQLENLANTSRISPEDSALLDRLKQIKGGLQLVRDEFGNYKVDAGTMVALNAEAAISFGDIKKAIEGNASAAKTGVGGITQLNEASNKLIFGGKEITTTWQTAWDVFKQTTAEDAVNSMKAFDDEQKAIKDVADSMWPDIKKQVGDPSIPENINKATAELTAFGQEHKDLQPMVDILLEKLKKYGEVNFDPMINGIKSANDEFQGMINTIDMNIEKEKQLFKLATNATGIKLPAGAAQTSANVLTERTNRKEGLPDTTGITAADDSFSKLILTIQQYRDTMGDASKAARNLSEDEFNGVVADQAYIASHTDVNAILNDTRENTIALGQARQEGIDKVKESTDATVLKIASDQAELEKLHEVNGEFDTHNGLLKDNIENNLLVRDANLGSADAIEQQAKNLNEVLVASDKYAQITHDVAEALFDAAKEAGGLTQEQNTLKGIIEGTTTANDGEIQSIINKIAAYQQLALAHGTVGATALQMSAAVVSGHATADQVIAKTGIDAAAEAAQIERMEQVLIAKGINVVALLHKLNQEASIQNLTLIASAAAGSPSAKIDLNSQLQQVAKKSADAASKASKDSQKQKIDEKKIREEAVQSALKEVEVYSSVIKKNIEETKSIRDMALEFGVAESALKKFNKEMTEFGTATNKAQISLLKLTLTQAENLKYLHSQTQATKDLLNAQIEGAGAAREFEKNTRMDAIANKEELKQLEEISKQLGISLPASVKPTLENMHLLIEASYGSAEALEDLKKSFTETSKLAEFFGAEIDDAKSAIREGHFSDFVKRELLFTQGADEFTSKIQLRVESEVKLEDIGEQLKKQMALINMDPEMFNKTMNDEDLKAGVRRTIASISQAVGSDPKLKDQWQPIVDELTKVLSSPDASNAIVEFSKKFPDFLGPALTGVDIAVKGLDTTINNTLKDDGGEAAKVLKDGLKDVDSHADKLEKTLLKAAKAMNSASKSAGDFGNLLGDMLGDQKKFEVGTLQIWHNTAETRKEAQKLTDILTAGVGTGPASGKDHNPDKTLEWDKTNPFKVTKTPGGGTSVLQTVRDVITEANKISPIIKGVETQVTTSTGIMGSNITATGTAMLGIGTNATTAAAEVGTAKDTTSTNMTALETDVKAAATSIGAAWKSIVDGIQLGNDWIEEHIVTPITTFDWAGAVGTAQKWGTQLIVGIGQGLGIVKTWVTDNIVTPILTFDWAGVGTKASEWGQAIITNLGTGLGIIKDWGMTNIVNPILALPWGDVIAVAKDWGGLILENITAGLTIIKDWGMENIVKPITALPWGDVITVAKDWGGLILENLTAGLTIIKDWGMTNIVNPITALPWGDVIAVAKDWGGLILENITAGLTSIKDWATTNIVTPITSYPWGTAISTLKDWGTTILSTIKGGITGVGEWVKTNIATPITSAGTNFMSGIESIKSWGTDIFTQIGKSLSQESVNKWIQDNIVSKITSFDWGAAWKATLDFLNPFKGASGDEGDKNNPPKTDGNKPTKITTPTIETGAGGWDAWKKTAQEAMSAVEKTAIGFASTIQSYFSGNITIALTTAGTAMTTLKTGWGTDMKAMESTVKGFATTEATYFQGNITNAINFAKTTMTTFKDTAAADMKSMESTTKGFATTEATYFKANITLAVNVAKTAITTMKTTSAADMKSMEATTKGFASTEASWLATGANSVKKSADTARASITTMKTTGASDMKSMEGTAKTFAGNLKTDFGTTIKNAADSATKAIKAVGDMMDSIKGKKATVTIDVKLNNSTGLPDSSLGNLKFGAEGLSTIVSAPTHFIAGERREPELVMVMPLSGGGNVSGRSSATIDLPKLPDIMGLGAKLGNQPRLPQNFAGNLIRSIIHHLPLKIDSPLIIDGREIGRIIREHSLEFIDSEL